MADISVPGGAWAAIGAALSAAATALWTRGNSAKDQTIAVLQAENERLLRERNDLGERLDATRAQLERERLQAAGVALRMRMDSKVDDALADDMPTAVRDRADLIAPRPKSLPPEVTHELVTYTSDMAETPPDPVMARKR